MICKIGTHFLYRHIRLDTGDPFYIGIGSKKDYKTYKSAYERAFSKDSRNPYWKNIVNKTDYEIEILLESDDYEFIKQKEIEFIALYQRKDCCNGYLSNMTTGGDGVLGLVHSEDSIASMINNKKIKKAETILNIKEDVVTLYSKGVVIIEIAKIVKVNKNTVKLILEKEGMLKNSSDYKKSVFYVYDFKNNEITYHYAKYNEISDILGVSEARIRNHIKTDKPIIDVGYLVLDVLLDFDVVKETYQKRALNKGRLKKVSK